MGADQPPGHSVQGGPRGGPPDLRGGRCVGLARPILPAAGGEPHRGGARPAAGDYKGDYDVFLQENDEEAEAEEVRVGEKSRLKKEKAKAFQAKKKGGKTKNAGRWS